MSEYQRGFDDAKDAIGKLIAGAISGLAGMTMIAEAGGKTEDAMKGEAVTTALTMVIDEIDGIKPNSQS